MNSARYDPVLSPGNWPISVNPVL